MVLHLRAWRVCILSEQGTIITKILVTRTHVDGHDEPSLGVIFPWSITKKHHIAEKEKGIQLTACSTAVVATPPEVVHVG